MSRASGTCKSCGRPRPCQDCAQDRAAQAWVAAHHPDARADLPSEASTQRLLGGGLERGDRGNPQDLARRLVRDRIQALELRHFLEIQEQRLRALRSAETGIASEIEHTRRVVTVLRMRLEGEGAELSAIAEAIGYRSHSSVSDLLARVQQEASARYAERRGSATYPCRCGRPGCVVVGTLGVGRPRVYAPKCAGPDRLRRWRRRRRVSVAVSVSPDGGSDISGYVGVQGRV